MWHMFIVNNKDTRMTPLASFGVFIFNFEHISHLVLVFLLLTLSRYMSTGVGITKMKQYEAMEWQNNENDDMTKPNNRDYFHNV